MAKYKKKYPMYATGTGPHGIGNAYLETPSGELAENDIAVAAGMEDAATNPWTRGMQVLGKMAMNYGVKNFQGFNFGQNEEEVVPTEVMATGGRVGQRSVNVEGDEVGELPNGEAFEFKGPGHEEGGIDVNLPVGTDIFSDRIKMKGKTMADRKKARIKSVTDLEKKLKDNPTDKIVQSTLERVHLNNEKEELKDKKIQQVVGAIQNFATGQFAFGTGLDGVDPTVPPSTDPTLNLQSGVAFGTGMPEQFQNKYVHYAPTTVLNDEEAYYRTFNDVLKNIFSTEKGRLNADRGLVTTTFATGGTVGINGEPIDPPKKPLQGNSMNWQVPVLNIDPQPTKTYPPGESPEEIKAAFNAKYAEENKDVQGWVRNTYYDPECNCNRTEEVPLPLGQDVPTDGVFIPKGSTAAPNWLLKQVPTFAVGGTVTNPPNFDIQALFNTLNQLSTAQQPGQSIIGPKGETSPGVFPGMWEDYVKWRNEQGNPIDDQGNAVYSENTYGETGLRLMEEKPESEFKLDPINNSENVLDKLKTGVGNVLNSTNNINSQVTPGNIMGLAGNAVSTLAPLITTLENRAGDTPNENYMLNYGDRGLETIDKSKKFVTGARDTNLKSLEQNKQQARKLSRTSARSLNTKRALDLGIEIAGNSAENEIYSNFASVMSGILGQEAGLQNQQDQIVMSGEANRDISDRQDRDNFYTNLGVARGAIGEGLQETGKDLNFARQQEVMMNLINQLSKYGITIDNMGNLGSNG